MRMAPLAPAFECLVPSWGTVKKDEVPEGARPSLLLTPLCFQLVSYYSCACTSLPTTVPPAIMILNHPLKQAPIKCFLL